MRFARKSKLSLFSLLQKSPASTQALVSRLKPDESRLMRPLAALIDVDDPALPLIRELAASSGDAVILAPDEDVHEKVLLRLQVTTRSVLGAVGYETGGILVDAGRIRVLGGASAHC